MKTLRLALLPLLIAVLIARISGCSDQSGTSPPNAHSKHKDAKEDTVWTCSMHPQIRQSRPGSCPICGMDLIPLKGAESTAVEQTDADKPKKSVKYACSMFCVPPMEQPGLCPVCGMDMVPVEEDEAEGSEPSTDAVITLSPTARRLAQVDLAKVERRFVDAEIRMVGKVDFDETRIGVITARVHGRLDRLYVDYTGVAVNKGDHLVYFYSPDLLTAQEELLQAVKGVKESESIGIAALREAAEETVRTVRDKLLLWGLTPEQLDEIEQRGTLSDHITIYAPMGGIVIEKDAVEGMYVETGTKIYTIADLSEVWVKLDAYESDLAWIRYGQSVEFETEAYPGRKFSGTVAFIDPVLNAKTRTIRLRVNAANPDGLLKPNMFVRAILHSRMTAGGRVQGPGFAGRWICPMHPDVVSSAPGPCSQCGMALVAAESLDFVHTGTDAAEAPLVIPATAPLLTGKRAIVYVGIPGDASRFEMRGVTLGPRAGEHYLVTEGLHEGESVVVRGNFFIDSARQILGKPSMMSSEAGVPPPTHHHGHDAKGTDKGSDQRD